MPQMRHDDKGRVAGLSPQTLLFATRSSMRNGRISQIQPKSSCQSHQCLRCVGPGADVLEPECLAGFGKVLGFVAGAVIAHHTRDRDAETVVVGDGGLEEGNGTAGLFIREDVGKGDAGGIVDADMDLFPADTA
jgi:hypothetical protein